MNKEITIDGKLYRLVEEEETDKMVYCFAKSNYTKLQNLRSEVTIFTETSYCSKCYDNAEERDKALDEYIESLKPWIPKVGDWVRITKSCNDWVYGMDKFVGMVVQIIEIANEFDECRITFHKYDGWSWSYREGHFVKATDEEVKAHLAEKENPKLDYGNGIGYNPCKRKFLFEFDGHKYCEGDKPWFFDKVTYEINQHTGILYLSNMGELGNNSKSYPTKGMCEHALNVYVYDNHKLTLKDCFEMHNDNTTTWKDLVDEVIKLKSEQ